MESTYGDRVHGEEEIKNKREQLEEVIKKTAEKGGNLIIPAFAVERTQDLLYHLTRLETENKLYGMEIVIDSPLAISATEIFCKYPEYYDEEARELRSSSGECPIIPKGLQIAREVEESMALNKVKGGKIIISASGMCDAGRIKHHLKHNVWRKECSVLFVGYQAPGTLGRRILEGAEKVRIHGEEIKVEADIFAVKGFSAHADLPGIINWVKGFKEKPDKIFYTHGEPEAAKNLAKRIKEELAIDGEVPNWLDEVDLHEPVVKVEVAQSQEKEINAGHVWELYSELQSQLSTLVQNRIEKGKYKEVAEILRKMLQNLK
ncbi:MAG: metallo-beta-lactamase family protein [Clostridia bacterium]|nr:metallo-beta-lactamase family protein [Clostridia bacterium]